MKDEDALRAWLVAQGVTGYPQSLLIMERFGYPHFLVASPEQLIEAQYAGRPKLRAVLDAIIATTEGFGGVAQARKTYVSLLSPRRIFARVHRTSNSRVDLCLRLERAKPEGRLRPSKIHALMPLQLELTCAGEVDAEAAEWLHRAYVENT